MLFQELPDRITLMPTCTVNIQPDGVAAKLNIQVLQHLEKALSITAFRLDHPCAAQERGHPTGNVQAFLMLAGCRNLQPFANKRPTPAQPWMQGKAALVLKNNSFLRPQRLEFFLGSWQTFSHPRPLLGDRHGWLASADTRADASNTGPDGPSALSQTVAGYGSPRWGRPSGRGSIRTSEAIPPDGAQAVRRPSASYGPGDLTAFSGPGLRPRSYLPPGSSGLHSSGSGPEPPRSSPVVAPPKPEGGWRSLFRSRPRVLSRSRPTIALWRLFLNLKEVFSCLQYNTLSIVM